MFPWFLIPYRILNSVRPYTSESSIRPIDKLFIFDLQCGSAVWLLEESRLLSLPFRRLAVAVSKQQFARSSAQLGWDTGIIFVFTSRRATTSRGQRANECRGASAVS